MKPKKKSLAEPIIYGIALVIVVFICLHGAIAYETTQTLYEQGQIANNQRVMNCLNGLMEHLTYKSEEIYFNAYTKQWLTWGCFGWLIVVLMITSSKRNYIHGKEFGTAKWGTLNDVKDLFSTTIIAQEIRKAKQVSHIIGRYKVRSNVYKECEKNGQAELKIKLSRAKEREEERKKNGTSNKKLYEEEIKNIKAENKESVALSKRMAWKPDQYAYDLKLSLEEIENNSLLNEEEKKKEKEKAKQVYKRKLKDFKNSKERVRKIEQTYKHADMILTQTERVCFYNYKLNCNQLIIGGSGTGKSRSLIMPNILNVGDGSGDKGFCSMVITDPKGELLEKSGHFLDNVMGYKIRVLNLDDKGLSDGYNPFVYIHPERAGYEERVLSLIETIILNTDGGEKKDGGDPFWGKAERLFLQSIFFFTTDGFVPEERNMSTVMKLIAMLEIGEEEDNRDSDLDYFAKIFARRYGKDHIGVQQYNEFRSKASGKTAKSIVISAVARLAPFRTKEVRRIFSYDTMSLERIGEEPTAIFVVVPPTDPSFNFIAGMLFTQLFQEIQYCATTVHKHDGQRLPVPVRFLMDEFANTAEVPNFTRILAYARSLGVGISIVIQSLEQLKKMYKDEWGVIVDNCNELLYLGGVTHTETLEFLSKLIGKGTFDKRTTGRTRGRQGSSSENFDVVGRELMFADDIRRIPKEDCILVLGGRPAFYSKKYKYESHPNYRFTSDGNKGNSYYFKPTPPPIKEKSISHGEETAVEPNEDGFVAETPIEVETDLSKELVAITQGFGTLAPIDNQFINVDDGEIVSDEDYLEHLAEVNDTDEAEENALMENAVDIVEEALKEAEITAPQIVSLSKEIMMIGRTWRNLVPLPNGFITVDDGEEDEFTEEEVSLIMDEEEYTPSADELEDSSLEDNLMSLIEQMEEEIEFDKNIT